MALHSIEPMYFSDISKNAFLFLVAQRRVNLPDKNWVIKSSKSVPKKKKLSLNFLLAKILRKSSYLIAQYVLFNMRTLSTNSQVKWTHQRDVPYSLYSLMHSWVHSQVLQFEEQAYKDLQYLISVLLVQPNFLLFLSTLF